MFKIIQGFIRGVLNDAARALQTYALIRALSLILISIILAKNIVSTTSIGIYETLMFLAMLFSSFWVNGIIKSLIARYNDWNAVSQESTLSQLIIFFTGISLLLGLCGYLLGSDIARFINNEQILEIWPLWCIWVIVYFPGFLVENILFLRKKAKELVLYGLLSFGILLLGFIIITASHNDIRFLFYFLIAWSSSIYIFLLFLGFAGKKIGEWKLTGLLIIPAIPLIMQTFFSSSAFLFDQWLVSWYYGSSEQFAIFRYGARELPFSMALAAALSLGVIPAITESAINGFSLIKKRTSRIIHWVFPVGILLMLSADWIFPMIFNEAFTSSAPIFKVYLLILISRFLFPQSILIALKKDRTILLISVVEISINIILSLVLIRHLGLIGVAWATVIAFSLDKVIAVCILYLRENISITAYTPIRAYLLWSVALISAYLITI